MSGRRRPYSIVAGVSLLVAVSAVGCSPVYVIRAGFEEAKILWRREPISELLANDRFDAATREKLELVLQVRTFARDILGLRVGGSYATYARLDPDQVIHIVTAAERFRLEPYTWWFPIVGRVPYKGFFSADAARELESQLENEGYDTYVRASAAFSTLGWFDDPLLSTTLRRDPVALVDTVIHELLHNTYYIGGHASFAESFANFVGHRGAVLFFTGRDDPDALQKADNRWQDALLFSQFLTDFLADLDRAYQTGVTIDERDELFHEGQRRFQAISFSGSGYTGFATMHLNNAILLHERLYFDRLMLFEKVFRANDGDLPGTIAAVLDAIDAGGGDPYDAVAKLAATTAAPSDLEVGQAANPDAGRECEDGDRQTCGAGQ